MRSGPGSGAHRPRPAGERLRLERHTGRQAAGRGGNTCSPPRAHFEGGGGSWKRISRSSTPPVVPMTPPAPPRAWPTSCSCRCNPHWPTSTRCPPRSTSSAWQGGSRRGRSSPACGLPGTGTRRQPAWLAAKGVEVCPVSLGERVVYQDAYALGLGVSEAEPAGKAAEEIQQVYNYICRILGLPTTERAHDEKAERARKRTA